MCNANRECTLQNGDFFVRELPVGQILVRLGWIVDIREGIPGDDQTADRRLERRIIREYEADIGFLLKHLSRDHADAARGLASLPARIRGFGPVKEKAYQATRKERQQLRAEINPSAREHQQIANAAV